MMKKILLAATLLATTVPFAKADEGLYPDAPPADAAFIRVINTSNDTMLAASLAGIALPEIKSHNVSDYAVVTEGDIAVKIGDVSNTKSLLAGQYYTSSQSNDSIILIKDKKPENPSKAVINFYNLSDVKNVSLVSTTHNADIFKDVKSGRHDARDINAVSIGLAVKNGNDVMSELNDVKLERHISTSLFFIGQDGAYDMVVNNNAPYK